MFNDFIRDYFSFTKKERTGIMVFLVIIVIVFLLPHFFNSASLKADPRDFDQFKNELDSLAAKKDSPTFRPKAYAETREENFERPPSSSLRLFYFDPNQIEAGQWKALGLRDRTINTIRNYLSKGGQFRKPADLQKVYGLREEEFRRLEPFIRITEHENSRSFELAGKKNAAPFHAAVPEIKIDINTADSIQWMQLRGIGSKLAARIIHFREKLGGFCSVEQVGETYLLPDSVFRNIKSQLVPGHETIRQMDLNSASPELLMQHPYIRWKLANAIVQYRRQHGPFGKKEDLLALPTIDSALFRKISPYFLIKN